MFSRSLSRDVVGGAAAALFLLSCTETIIKQGAGGGPGGAGSTQPTAEVLFAPATKHVVVEIDYAAGAEPYVGGVGSITDVWKIFGANMAAVFEGRKDVSYPTKLSGMEKLDDVTATEFTSQDLLDVATAHRTEISEGETVTYYVVFVNGYFKNDDGEVDKNVLGVSVGNSGVIGMFKPVISATSTAKFVEQSALIHEMGHAIGFVNNGVPLAAGNAHHDAAHGAHCTNTSCVMHWKNEGAKDAIEFARRFIITDNAVLYDQACLSDARVLENNLPK